MKWDDLRRSDNVEDQRGMGGGTILAGGGGLVTLVVVVLYALLGGDPKQLVQQLPQGGGGGGQQQVQLSEEDKKLGDFVSAVLGDTEDVWTRVFKEQVGKPYVDPKLVLFSDQVQSGCGFASAASGPFYCPEDSKVYIDLSFYRELQQRFHAPGQFAEAYVIAHEVGHHVQNLLGTSDKVRAAEERASATQRNQLSVRLELQADFYAGVWAHYAQKYQNIIESGDIDSAINAASQIGDDKIQQQTQGRVVPDSFTHGTGAQRVKWFRKGYETGDIKQGDTFNANDL